MKYIATSRSLVDLILMRKIFQKTELNFVVYFFNLIEKIFGERFYNSTLITAGVLTISTIEKTVEVLPATVWVIG